MSHPVSAENCVSFKRAQEKDAPITEHLSATCVFKLQRWLMIHVRLIILKGLERLVLAPWWLHVVKTTCGRIKEHFSPASSFPARHLFSFIWLFQYLLKRLRHIPSHLAPDTLTSPCFLSSFLSPVGSFFLFLSRPPLPCVLMRASWVNVSHRTNRQRR